MAEGVVTREARLDGFCYAAIGGSNPGVFPAPPRPSARGAASASENAQPLLWRLLCRGTTMPYSHIRIAWHSETEYLALDLAKLPRKGSSIKSVAKWPTDKTLVEYKATCVQSRSLRDEVVLELSYRASANSHLRQSDARWGVSRIHISTRKRTGFATWEDADDDRCSGRVQAKVLSQEIVDESQTTTRISRIARPMQQAMRRTLLDCDGRCAITGETTEAALELAHILDVQKKGATSVYNCLLLRADLHRLFDQHLIRICRNGELKLDRRVSEAYRNELAELRVDEAVVNRIADALSKRTGSRPSTS